MGALLDEAFGLGRDAVVFCLPAIVGEGLLLEADATGRWILAGLPEIYGATSSSRDSSPSSPSTSSRFRLLGRVGPQPEGVPFLGAIDKDALVGAACIGLDGLAV